MCGSTVSARDVPRRSRSSARTPAPEPEQRFPTVSVLLAIATSVMLCLLRLDIARKVGFGDTEALFVAYGFHPQPAYVDYPGLIGWLARGLPPDPHAIHIATTLAATALPWAGVLAAWANGAPPAAALRAYFPLALLPALSIGSFAFTPDLPLAYCWLLALACSGHVLREPVTSFSALLACVGAGVAAALACLSKTSGWMLAACLLLTFLGRGERQRFRTIAPWAACGMFAILTTPLLTYWWRRGINLELDPELSWQHAALMLGRPVLSMTPPFLVGAVLVAANLLRAPREAPVDRALRYHLLLPLLPLAVLATCTGAETDWLTPAYLALSLQLARMPALRRSLRWTCLGTGYGVAVLGWCWLRTSLPLASGQWLGNYDPTLDPSNDFYAWGPGKALLEDAVASAHERTGQLPIVVGPNWSVCAQAEVALRGQVHVGCDSQEQDDYDLWSDPALWASAQTILFITDSRFHRAPPESFYGRDAVAVHRAVVERFGQAVRALSISEFDRDEGTARLLHPRVAPGP
jgi:Dolichyl-phosphate-mannose-protein mannosyltransferase